MRRRHKDYLVAASDDGLPAAEVGPWAVEKYRRVGMYAEIFSTGMKNRWDCRTYIDLFAGPGHAVVRERGQRILTSPLLALTVPDPFDHYILCDREPAFVKALEARASIIAPGTAIEFVTADANESVSDIERRIPAHCLSFCFVDPFGLDIHFKTIQQLSTSRPIDFLILLALGMDATRNWDLYNRPGNTKVERFIGDPTWRERWATAERDGFTPIRFLAQEYARAMATLGYLTTSLDQMIEVRTYDNNMRLYYLAFFSKKDKGYEFWREVQKYSSDQLGLGF